MENGKTCNIFALSDYSLLHIFKYLSSTDLYHLSQTCKRFEGLVKEKKLWCKIDGRDGLNQKAKIKYCVQRFNKRTKEFRICCDKRDVQLLPDNLFTSRNFPHLTVLALENQLIRGDLAKLSEYPRSIVELSFRKSFVHSHSTFFKLSYLHMDNLKVLILDECGWVETYMLVPMSKYPKLEILSLYQCKKLSDNDIAYLSLAGCFGFKLLRVLDIRCTGLGDQILKTFYKHPTLNELYFQNYITTETLDRASRRLEIARGSPMKPYPYFSEYDNIADTNLPSMEKVFGYHFYRTSRRQNVTNHGTVMYKFVVPTLDVDYDVKSVLYISPYGECNCGYQSRNDRLNYELDTTTTTTTLQPKPENTKISREEIDKLKNIIKSEKYKKSNPHVYVLAPKLPMDPYKNQTDIACYEEQASENNKQIDWINVREPITEFEMAMFEHTDIHSLETEALLPTIRRHYSSHPSVILGSRLGNPGSDNPPDDPDEDEIDPDRLIVLGDRDIVVEEVFQESSDDSNDEVRTESKENISDKDGSSEDSGVKSEDSAELRKGNSKADAPDTEERRIAKAPVIVSKSDGKLIYHRLRYNDGSIEKDNAIERKRNSKDDSKPSTSTYSQTQKKCKICSAEMSKNKRGDVCKKCSERPAKNKIFRFKSVRHKKDDIETKAMRGENLPSTSKDELYHPVPSTSNSHKRNRDDSSDVTDAKKFKSSSDNEACLSDLDYDLDISFEVKDVNEREPSNMFFIDFHDPDADLMNVPIGGGLINILLGADTKTRTAIKKLSLRGFARITDCTLDYLNALKLDLLDVTRTGVSVGAVANFIRQNPMCRVLHESACTCLPNMHF